VAVLPLVRRRLIDRLVLRPSRHPIDPGPQQRMLLSHRGRPLECFVQRHPVQHDVGGTDERRGVLVIKFPGTSGRAEQSTGMPLSLLDGIGGSTWTWNPPGYGGSGGRASLTEIAAAAETFAREVIDRESHQHAAIWLSGNSIGCATALHVASSIDFDQSNTGLVLRNPPPMIDVVKHVARRYPLGHLIHRLAESLYEPMNVMLTAGRVALPAVFLQSGADTLVPPEFQDRVIQTYRGDFQKVVLAGLSHAGVASEAQEAQIRHSLQWLLAQTGIP
jgi:pimeloyl-ACP methyl ester carboxylesterase